MGDLEVTETNLNYTVVICTKIAICPSLYEFIARRLTELYPNINI